MTHPARHRLEWLALLCLRLFARALPERISRAAGALLGRLIAILWSSRRRIAHDNLKRAFPEWNNERIGAVANDTFTGFGRTAFEILRIDKSEPVRLLKLVTCNRPEALETAYQSGRGALLLSGHFGNWELLAGWVRALGYPLDVVVKPLRNPLADEFYNKLRRDLQVGIIHTQVATRGIVRAVRDKGFVAILADQYAGEEGVSVEFFGRPVSTPRGPAALSLKFGCPIVTGVLRRKPDGSFFADLDGPVEIAPTGDHERDVVALTQAFTTRLEHHIRRTPEQWLWTHRRWRDG